MDILENLVIHSQDVLSEKGYIDDFDVERICAELADWRQGPDLIRELVRRQIIEAAAFSAGGTDSFRIYFAGKAMNATKGTRHSGYLPDVSL